MNEQAKILIDNIVFKLRHHNSEFTQDIADELERAYDFILSKEELKKDNIKETREKVKRYILEAYDKDKEDYTYLVGFNTGLSYILGEFSQLGPENKTYRKYLSFNI